MSRLYTPPPSLPLAPPAMFSVMLNSCKGNFARTGRGNGLICTLNCIFNFLTVIKYMFHIHIIRIPGVNKQWPLACPEFLNL